MRHRNELTSTHLREEEPMVHALVTNRDTEGDWDLEDDRTERDGLVDTIVSGHVVELAEPVGEQVDWGHADDDAPEPGQGP